MMTEIRLFDKEKDGETVMEWADERDYPFDVELLPETTWIAPDVAVACIYLTNHPKVCFLDHLLSNPQTEAKARDEALQALLMHLVKTTGDAGFERVIMFTSNPAVIKRGIERFKTDVYKARSPMIFHHKRLA